jgi:RNA polymerase sigma-70 factor (ECF subfamily)
MEPDANAVLERARRGEASAANELIELFYGRVFAFLRRLTSHDADAADLTQRTFSRAWQSLPTFAGHSSVNSWFHGIAYHVYVDWRRTDHRGDPRSEEWWLCRADGRPSPAETVAQADLAALVYASVDALEPEVRDTIHLHYYQGLTIDETAQALGVATSTVKYRCRQGLELLQKKFAPEKSCS